MIIPQKNLKNILYDVLQNSGRMNPTPTPDATLYSKKF